MLNEQDFDSIFSAFSTSGTGSGIKEVYNIMPYMNDTQIKIYVDAVFFAEKWQLQGVKEYLDSLIAIKKINRPLGFMPSVKNFLKYSTLDEKIRNVKIQQSNGDGQ